MNYFCSIANHTYATLDLNDERGISIKRNFEIIGFLGKKVDDLLIKKSLRKCKLIGEGNLGEKLDNGTWTGNLGLIKKGDAILYLKTEVRLIDTSIETWMNYLLPAKSEKFIFFQEISKELKKASSEVNSSDVLNCFNFDLTYIFLFILANLLSFSIWILFKLFLSKQNLKVRKRRKRLSTIVRIKKILINLLNGQWNLDYSKLTKLSLFILFYSLHFWFIQLIIANNMKTDKVIVDQSILIRNENDALMAKNVFCLLEGEAELSIALSSNSNILSKLYNQKGILSKPLEELNLKKGEKCVLKKSLNILHMEIKDIFTLAPEVLLWLTTSLLGSARPDLTVWFSEKPIFEMDYHFIIKNQKDLIDLYNWIMLLYTESGIFKRLFDSLILDSNAFFQSHTVYRTIEEFINGNSKFTVLNTDSFKLLFVIYISFCLTILIINLLHYLIVKISLFYFFYCTLDFIKN